MKLEEQIQSKMSRFLDGPATFQIAALKRSGSRRYRSSSLALAAWSFALFRSVLSPVALWLLPAVFVIGVYASIAMEAPMRVWVLVFLAVFLVELAVGALFRPSVEIDRQMPERVRAGSVFHIRYRVRNRRRLPAWDLRADPFRFTPELVTELPAEFPELPGRQTLTARATVRALRRGRCLIYGPRVESGFPFGLIRWSSGCRRDRNMLTVYPAFTSLRRFDLPFGARCQSSGMVSYSKIGESTELIGVRDYRDRDDVRRIDWPGSARTGNFVVKEFEEDELRRVALITDTFIPAPAFWSLRTTPKGYPQLEAALALTAALAEYLSRGEAVVEIFAVGPAVYHFETGRSSGSFESVCDILSGIEPSREPALSRLEPEVFRDLSATGGAVVVLLGVDEPRRSFVERLHEAGVSVRVLVLSERAVPDLPPGWLALSPAAVLAGEVTEL